VRKLILALALGAILLPNHGFTLGLGEIEVNSSLNQKLAARIDLLSAAPEDAESLIIKLASREEFIRAGLDRPMVVTTLKFKAVVEDGHVYIDVITPKPIREPFLNFLVEVDWPKGHLIREYTILLDPPVFMGQTGIQKTASDSNRPAMQQAAVAGSAPVSVQSSVAADNFRPTVQSSAPVKPDASVPVTAEVYAPETTQQTSYTPYAPPAGHRVQVGDTAWSLANSMKPDASISTEQMMIAMLRANPEVFINENVNGLKRGYILRTPDYADITSISNEEAKAIVRQQNALWREYQQSMASDQPASAIEESSAESEYSSAVNANNESRLSIVSAGAGSSASGEMKDPSEMTADELREQLALTHERVETERVEKEMLQKQVGSLATQVDKMKGLIAIEDDAMAEIQSIGASSDAEVVAADSPAEEVVTENLVTEPVSEKEALDALDALMGNSEVEQGAVTETAEELFVDPAAESEQAVEMETVTEQEMPGETAPDYTQQQEASLIDILLNNRMILIGILIALLVIGAIAYLIKRRRDNASGEADLSAGDIFKTSEEDALENVADMIDDESIDDLVTDEEVKESMAEAEAEEEVFDAEATMILPSGTGTIVTPAANLQPEEQEEQDDVMAEADVYLAYGIYQQAEELLVNAIKEHPEKDSYRVKLAETYYAGKNAEAFEKLGVDMKERLGSEETPAWAKVVAMGKELCPEADVFQQSDLNADLDMNDLKPKSPEPMDIDLGDVDDGVADLDLDFDTPLDDTGLELPSMDMDESADFELPSMDMDETAILSPEDTANSLDELEFDLSETDAVAATPAPAEDEEFSLDIEASELDLDMTSEATDNDLDAGLDMDFDLSTDSVEENTDTADEGMDFNLDMSMEDNTASDSDEAVDLDLSMDDIASEDDAALEFDLSEQAEAEGMSDDLDMSDAADLDLSMDDDLGGMDLSETVDVDEINTKLDLAKAYLDMGDHEGARDILDEVIAGGNAEQKKEAQELMAQAS